MGNELFDVIEHALTLAERNPDSKVSRRGVSVSAKVKRSLDSPKEGEPDSTATENEDSEEEEEEELGARPKKKRRTSKQKSTAPRGASRRTSAATSKSARRAPRKGPKAPSKASDNKSASRDSSAQNGLWKIEKVFDDDIIINTEGIEYVRVAWFPTECSSEEEALELCKSWPGSHESIDYHEPLKKWFVNWTRSYRPRDKIFVIT